MPSAERVETAREAEKKIDDASKRAVDRAHA